ncbi:MAG: cobalt-precorrin-5B (C(1))-methyltransferase [Herpetosiphon sp.]
MPPETVPPRDRKGSRTGWTTGTCATAAATAATLALLGAGPIETVTVSLPNGNTATFTPGEWQTDDHSAYCCVVKDAGDDPDVTHGALICARVSWSATPGLHLEGGHGVGRVTLPGLGLPVGGPAINPVPRSQISTNVQAAGGNLVNTRGLDVVIEVPRGPELARQTLNPRLGIIGGISILGTSGVVKPYSTAAWRASVVQAVEMAAANHVERIVLTTGSRTEKYAMRIFPELPTVAFAELSVFTGAGLDAARRSGVRQVVFASMIGKLAKTAQGHLTTHVAGNAVDLNFLATVAADHGAPPELVAEIRAANTARHVLELCQAHKCMAPLQGLCELAVEQCARYTAGTLDLEVILVDFDGTVLARASMAHTALSTAPTAPPLIERLARGDDDEEPQ